MAINQNPTLKYVVASADVVHGAPASDDGWCGQAHMQATKDVSNTVKADLQTIKAGERYLLKLEGEIEVPIAAAQTGATGQAVGSANVLTGATAGQLVYIVDATNVCTLDATGLGVNRRILGKVSCLPNERGCPAGFLRINLSQKVA